MKSRLCIAAALLAIRPMGMTEDAPAAEPTQDAQAEPTQDTGDSASFSVDIPAEHSDLFERIVSLVKSGEQWVLDNIHAGVTTLENLLNPPDQPQ